MSPASYRTAPPRGTRKEPSMRAGRAPNRGRRGSRHAPSALLDPLRGATPRDPLRGVALLDQREARRADAVAERQPTAVGPAPLALVGRHQLAEHLPRDLIVLVEEVDPQARVAERRQHL